MPAFTCHAPCPSTDLSLSLSLSLSLNLSYLHASRTPPAPPLGRVAHVSNSSHRPVCRHVLCLIGVSQSAAPYSILILDHWQRSFLPIRPSPSLLARTTHKGLTTRNSQAKRTPEQCRTSAGLAGIPPWAAAGGKMSGKGREGERAAHCSQVNSIMLLLISLRSAATHLLCLGPCRSSRKRAGGGGGAVRPILSGVQVGGRG